MLTLWRAKISGFTRPRIVVGGFAVSCFRPGEPEKSKVVRVLALLVAALSVVGLTSSVHTAEAATARLYSVSVRFIFSTERDSGQAALR